jgi:uncharacterized protein
MKHKQRQGFFAGLSIGSLGGMIGLGGTEFRLPLLVGHFRIHTLQAIILNKACSLVVVAVALGARQASIPWAQLWPHAGIVLNLLAGSLAGAWWAAGKAMHLPAALLNRIVFLLLLGLGFLMLTEAWIGLGTPGEALFVNAYWQGAAGLLAGLLIGTVAALLGVAGGELLIPTIVLLYGIDIKLAGSLSLMVSLPTMLAGFVRYRSATDFAVLQNEKPLLLALTAGSIVGAIAGGLMLGWIDKHLLLFGLSILLLVSAWKTFHHKHQT